jgi:hypothetical protein
VRAARGAVPSCAIGSVAPETVEPMWTDEIAQEVNVVFDFLGLEAVEIKSL